MEGTLMRISKVVEAEKCTMVESMFEGDYLIGYQVGEEWSCGHTSIQELASILFATWRK